MLLLNLEQVLVFKKGMTCEFHIGAPLSEAWKDLSRESEVSSFFQTEMCLQLYERTGLKSFVFHETEDGVLKGVVVGYVDANGNSLMRYMSRRAIVPGGALLANDIAEESVTDLFAGVAREMSSCAIYVEFRNYNDYSSYRNAIASSGFAYEDHLNFQINTKDGDLLMKRMRKTKRLYDIRNSEKQGTIIDENPTLDDVRSWYKILKDLYKTKVKTPLFERSFFEGAYGCDGVHYFVVKNEGNVIGGAMCVGDGEKIYEWFESGDDERYNSLHPSVMGTYAGIRYALRNQYELFDMMGAGREGDGYGVRAFKAKFGGELKEQGRFRFICNNVLYKIGELGVKIMKRT